MERARRHQRLLARLALVLLALVAELTGRSLTHRLDFGRHVAAPSYAGADYYPVLLAVVKVVPLVALGLAGLCFIRAERLVPTPFAPMDFLRAVLLLLYAFSGFEILTVPTEESLRPRRDLPFALIATILCVCAVYVLVHTAALGMLPGLGSDRAPLASAAGLIAGSAGRYAMTAIAAVSMAGCSLVSLVGATRLLYAMSSAGQIPAWMGALHAARRFAAAPRISGAQLHERGRRRIRRAKRTDVRQREIGVREARERDSSRADEPRPIVDEIDVAVGQADVVENVVHLGRRDLVPNRCLHKIAEPGRFLDTRTGLGAEVQ